MKYDFYECIGVRLRRLSRIVDTEFRNQLFEFGITENQLSILFVLKQKGSTEQGKIGDSLNLQRSTISRNIKLLEKKQLLKKTSDYRPSVQLTDKGLQMVDELIPIWEAIMDGLSDKLGKTGIESLKVLEKKLI